MSEETLRMMLDATTDKLNEYIDKTVEAEKRAETAERERDEARAELARLRPLVEAAKVFVDLVENNWECDCDARHVAVCRSCEATTLMARLSGVSP